MFWQEIENFWREGGSPLASCLVSHTDNEFRLNETTKKNTAEQQIRPIRRTEIQTATTSKHRIGWYGKRKTNPHLFRWPLRVFILCLSSSTGYRATASRVRPPRPAPVASLSPSRASLSG